MVVNGQTDVSSNAGATVQTINVVVKDELLLQ